MERAEAIVAIIADLYAQAAAASERAAALEVEVARLGAELAAATASSD